MADSYYNQSPLGHPSDPNVGLPQGWIARWDQGNQHWFYVDTSTGRTQWERPAVNYNAAPPSGRSGYSYDTNFDDKGYHKNWESHQSKYTAESHHEVPSSQPKSPKKNHNWLGYAAAGAGALGLGLLGGAVLENKADDIAGWTGEKIGKAEGKFNNLESDVVNAPENVAQWAGNKVGDVEGEFDNLKQDVEDAPEDVAQWAGRKVGKVEQFGDNIDNAYDEGRDEGRYEEDNDYEDDY